MGNTDEGLRRRRQQEPLMQQYSDSEGESAKDDQPEAKRPTAGGSAGHSDVNSFTSSDRIVSLLLTAVCAFTRLYQIGRRNLVSWDETHFGKFGAFYVNRTFYHDVHPPLAKMLVGLSEYISGHNGSFAYKLGTTYPEHVNYVFQRSFVALMSVMLVPFAYRTCRFLRFSRGFAAMAASFMIFDNALCVMSRFILLDQPLLCFTAMSLLGYAAFAAQRGQAFGPAWWRWLVFTGVSLGLVISSKWVGLFVIALVGLCTIEELFGLYSDRTTGAATQIKHWAARAVCLIVIPVAIYLACFKAHFAILNTRGTGDFKMPSAFQARQQNSVVALQPHEVAYGSQVTLRSHLPGFGLIHANESLRFPDKGIQQIAGGMAGKQAFNWWQITSLNGTWENSTSPVQHVNDGDLIRLVHVGTVHYLRTGRETPYYMGWDRR
ncbi:Protein O-mannosyltransferase 2, partial [Linderina pennispora]